MKREASLESLAMLKPETGIGDETEMRVIEGEKPAEQDSAQRAAVSAVEFARRALATHERRSGRWVSLSMRRSRYSA